jgi:putative ABC transport system permease protein
MRNPFRTPVRTAVVVLLLALVIGLFAVMVQAASLTRTQLGGLQASLQTQIELREAGDFGSGLSVPRDGEPALTIETLERIRRIPHAERIAKVEEYVYESRFDATKQNPYAMVIGLEPGSALRAIGELGSESGRIIRGRGLRPEDAGQDVAVVGTLYARQRTGISDPESATLAGERIDLNGRSFRVIGIYTTDNALSDNHAFVPLESFRRTFQPGDRLSKVWVTVDSVSHVPAVARDLRTLPGIDVVAADRQASTTQATLDSIAAATLYGSALLFAVGGVLVVFVMVLATKERVREIGTLKAIGAPNRAVALQFLAEVLVLILLAGMGAVLVAALSGGILERTLGLAVELDGGTVLWIALGGLAFGVLGSLYPVVRGIRLSPIRAMKNL